MTKMYVSDQEFVKAMLDAHKSSKSVKEVASRLGLEVASVRSRANKLRKAGVPIPKLSTERAKTDFAALAKMVDEYVSDTQTPTEEVVS